MLKAYFQLLRIPGIFTAFSNVLMGFLVSQTPSQNQILLFPLLISSGLLYSSGMILNDYFDYHIDKTERPARPLPSGKIQRKSALILGIVFLFFANISAFFAQTQTVLLTMAMSSLILLYNIKIKNIAPAGIFTLSLIRVFNVYLGFTATAFVSNTIFIPIPLAFLVASVGILSRVENESATSRILVLNFAMIGISIISLLLLTPQNVKYQYLTFLFIFIASISISSLKFNQKNSASIQNKITYQLLSITFLDATIVAMFSDILYATIVASLFIPMYILVKKVYLT